MPYVGRFAPSPTGALHLGTLTTAVASFLHARQSGGQWLVRIEDIDPPREAAGSADAILRALESLALEWDQAVLYQSSRIEAYRAAAESLIARGLAYYCSCSRRELGKLGSAVYPGTCRDRNLTAGDTALRVRLCGGVVEFIDELCGPMRVDARTAIGDFVIVRRDALPAYHLAVVLDDALQGVTDIVRGADLLNSTPNHICLQDMLGLPSPRYWHIPLVTDASGRKMSKSSGAAAIDVSAPAAAASSVLRQLGLRLPQDLIGAPVATLWTWAIENFEIASLARAPASDAAQSNSEQRS